jgi:hypothetical protein
MVDDARPSPRQTAATRGRARLHGTQRSGTHTASYVPLQLGAAVCTFVLAPVRAAER